MGGLHYHLWHAVEKSLRSDRKHVSTLQNNKARIQSVLIKNYRLERAQLQV
jgi:hypothetical protein